MRITIAIAHILKQDRSAHVATLQALEETLFDLDWSTYIEMDQRALDTDFLPEALQIFRDVLPGVDPTPYMEQLREDVIDAVRSAEHGNYVSALSASVAEQLIGADAIEMPLIDSAYFSDAKGKVTDDPYGAEYVTYVVALSSATLERPYATHGTPTEQLTAQFADALHGTVDTHDEFVDQTDNTDWQSSFRDNCTAIDTARHDLQRRAARLKAQIVHRVPLELRA